MCFPEKVQGKVSFNQKELHLMFFSFKFSTHYLLQCPTYSNERMVLLNKIRSINCSILEFSDVVVTKILLFGDNTLNDSCNTPILNSTIDYTSYLLKDLITSFWLPDKIINKKHYPTFLLAFLYHSILETV